ncbi:MAG: response regulator transcription factor [Chloroflexota bacterium]
MSAQKILIIEDEKRIAHWLKTYFERAGFEAVVCHDGHSGLAQARQANPTLIILDLMLPGVDGIEICQRLRQESAVPIIMLTAKGAQHDRINGLDLGADDYIVKPFDPAEVIARAKAVLRRTQGKVRSTLQIGKLIVDESAQSVTVDGQPISLSQAQFALLATLMRHPNQVLSRDQLIRIAFNDQYDSFDRAIDAHIKRLRKQIHSDSFAPIQTVYGAGYKFLVEEK